MTSHIVCPHCHATNRIPSDRLEDAPKCGQCKDLLFVAKPTDLNDSVFNKHINNNDIPVVVDFWASWCGPCKMMAPEFQKAAEQLEPKVRLAKVNTETNQQTAGQFGIRSIPAMIMFKNGKQVAQQAGAMSATQISDWILSNL
ncbi:MAG: thioredoxin TrxC [Thiotrichaceae bacterium]|nr:thioredoxin TrxC [Thiotrichaceae bacterium]